MKTILEYLNECKDMACHNLLCYSKTYGMDTPKEGYEEHFAEAQRDLEIVNLLMSREEKFKSVLQSVRENLQLSFSQEELEQSLKRRQHER